MSDSNDTTTTGVLIDVKSTSGEIVSVRDAMAEGAAELDTALAELNAAISDVEASLRARTYNSPEDKAFVLSVLDDTDPHLVRAEAQAFEDYDAIGAIVIPEAPRQKSLDSVVMANNLVGTGLNAE